MIETKRKTEDETGTQQQKSMVWQALGFAWNFGIIIVLPLVGFGLLGRFLDRKLGTSPWVFLGSAILAIVISAVLVTVRLGKIISNVVPPDDKNNNDHH